MTMPRWAAKWVRASIAATALLAAVSPVAADEEYGDVEIETPVAKPAKAKTAAALRVKQAAPAAAPPAPAAEAAEVPAPTAAIASAPAIAASSDPWSEEWTDETLDDCLPPVWSHWTLNLDAILWRRQTPDGLRLAVSNPGIEPDAASMTFDHEVGPRLAVIRRGISGWDVELNYFGIEGGYAELNMPDAVDPRVPGDNPGGLYASDALQLLIVGMKARYESRLHSEELNLRRDLNQTWTGLIGIRCIQLHENFHVDQGATLGPFYSIESENRLFGLQIGGEGKLFRTERFLLSMSAKAGLFENNSEQSTSDLTATGALSNTTPAPGVPPYSLNASTNQASFAGELGFIGTYRVSESILLRAGYNLMWLDDVALASEQLVVNEFQSQPPPITVDRREIRADGSLFYHGVTMGVGLTW
jgi:hypothetical protein